MSRLIKIISNPGSWFILLILILITLLHYYESLEHPTFIISMISSLGLARHAFERVLYLAPIVWAGFIFGWKGAFTVSLIALASMLPRAIFISLNPTDALLETVAVFIIGNVLSISFHALRKEGNYRAQLEVAHRELQASEERYRELFDNAYDAIWLHDLEENIIVANKSFVRLTGYSLEEFKGIKAGKLIAEGCIDRITGIEDPLLRGEAIGRFSEVTMIKKDKSKVFVQLSTTPVSSNGQVTGFQHIARNITEIKSAEEMLSKIVNGSPIPTFVISKSHRVLIWNKAIEVLSGIKPKEIIGTKEQWRAFYIENRPVMADLIVDGASSDQIEKYYLGKCLNYNLISGAYEAEDFFPALGQNGRWLNFTATPIRDSNDNIIGAIETLQDITEQKRMQENQNFYLHQATRSQEEERQRISREIHDDTIQALVVLSRQLDTLASSNEGLSEDKKARLEELWQQTNNIMHGLRRLSQDLRPAALDRLGLIPALEWLASDIAGYSGLVAKVSVTGTPRRFNEEVELVLFRIVQEALRNAWRHAEATKADITAEFDEDKTRITIIDNGKGFKTPEKIDDFARDGKLGLAGMHERAQLVGGTLTVQSQPGKGTSIAVELRA